MGNERVAVVGGGIAGVAAALRLRERLGPDATITVFEQGAALGGKLRTGELAGAVQELGAESFLAGDPAGGESAAMTLARRVGLGDRLVHPGTTQAALVIGGSLTNIPAGTLMGVPDDPARVASVARVPEGRDADAGRPLLGDDEDVAIGALIRRRFGDEVVDRLVDPLLGGVYAGRADELSLDMTVPGLARAARTERTLSAAVAAAKAASARARSARGWSPAASSATAAGTARTNLPAGSSPGAWGDGARSVSDPVPGQVLNESVAQGQAGAGAGGDGVRSALDSVPGRVSNESVGRGQTGPGVGGDGAWSASVPASRRVPSESVVRGQAGSGVGGDDSRSAFDAVLGRVSNESVGQGQTGPGAGGDGAWSASAPASRRVPSESAAQGQAGPGAGAAAPVFATIDGGLGRLVEAVAAAARAEVRLGLPVRALERDGDRGWILTVGAANAPGAAERVAYDAVVLALPAKPAARLLKDVQPGVAEVIGRLEYASLALVNMALPAAGLPRLSGLLVPSVEGLLIKAATFFGVKWPHLRRTDDVVHVRASVGRYRDEHLLQRDDAELAATAHAELSALLRSPLPQPIDTIVQRWGGALPQYAPGHRQRIAAARELLRASHPTLALAGAAYDGVGIPLCVRSGESAGDEVANAIRGDARAGSQAGGAWAGAAQAGGEQAAGAQASAGRASDGRADDARAGDVRASRPRAGDVASFSAVQESTEMRRSTVSRESA